jgi:hypothetical protein
LYSSTSIQTDDELAPITIEIETQTQAYLTVEKECVEVGIQTEFEVLVVEVEEFYYDDMERCDSEDLDSTEVNEEEEIEREVEDFMGKMVDSLVERVDMYSEMKALVHGVVDAVVEKVDVELQDDTVQIMVVENPVNDYKAMWEKELKEKKELLRQMDILVRGTLKTIQMQF